jgi:hypothetical protein
MDALKFLKEWKRMHDSVGGCLDCPLDKLDDIDCGMGAIYAPEKAIEIVQEWSKAHPQRTRLTVLLEQYPALKNIDRPFDEFCAGTMYGFDCTHDSDMYYDSCEECWNKPVDGD